MNDFTQDMAQPSERTLYIIRQIAYAYRTVSVNGKERVLCLN